MATLASSVIVRIDAKLACNVRQARGGNWVAICDPLGLTVQSETWTELMEDIGLTIDAMLKDLLNSRELDQFLKERGWKLLNPIPSTPKDLRFDLPFFPVMMGSDGPQRSLPK
jgi:predicted RNase H-like HicB family nuclease